MYIEQIAKVKTLRKTTNIAAVLGLSRNNHGLRFVEVEFVFAKERGVGRV